MLKQPRKSYQIDLYKQEYSMKRLAESINQILFVLKFISILVQLLIVKSELYSYVITVKNILVIMIQLMTLIFMCCRSLEALFFAVY